VTALEIARRRQQEDIAHLSLSVPRADDPELAEHALWNDTIAADAEKGAERDEVAEAALRAAGYRDCPCGLAAVPPGSGCPCGEMAAR
jgi:hypothetical protein